jgi:carbonic anhydrase
MKKNIIIAVIAAVAMVVIVSLSSFKHTLTKKESDHVKWSYQGESGPEHWANLSEKFRICAEGHSQSPVNILTDQLIPVDSNKLRINYQPTPLLMVNNGHTIKIKYKEKSHLTVGENTYRLLQFHFHTPSEHQINGVNHPMTLHLVHGTKDGKLSVVNVFIKEGEENPEIAKIIAHLPKTPMQKVKAEDVLVDASKLLPKKGSFYQLRGSLTTPPCSENVLWNILETPITLSKEQIETFKSVMGHNARPVQDLNDRNVLFVRTK